MGTENRSDWVLVDLGACCEVCSVRGKLNSALVVDGPAEQAGIGGSPHLTNSLKDLRYRKY